MSTITNINDSDLITVSNEVINDNFDNLNNDKIETSYLDTDTALTANSDSKIATQKSVKAYVDSGGNQNASTSQRGIVEEATLAEVDAGTTTGATGARLFINPSAQLRAQFSTTNVFTGTSPTSFTDLDLSSVIGTKQRVVVLKIKNNGTAASVWFRRNGDTDDMSLSLPGSTGPGIEVARVSSGVITTILTTTDTAGVVEWTTSSGVSMEVSVNAYW